MTPRDGVLVVDDDPAFARSLQILLEDEGSYTVELAHSGEQALAVLARRADLRLVLTDLAMPGMDGLELLRAVRQEEPGIAVVVMTAHASVKTAVEAIRLGAFQYLTKPVEPEELLVQVERALAGTRLEREHRLLAERAGEPERFDLLVGSSPGMRALRELVGRLAAVDSTLLLRGETGTGKELVARLIHGAGARAKRPFVVVNCTAIPGELLESELFGHEKGSFTGALAARPGRVEHAQGGTLLLDEIGDMPLPLQPKLLRFLQERTIRRIGGRDERAVDVRVMAATHRDLEAAVASGEFRADLYHRLNAIPLTIPPLRDHLEDLPELCRHLTAKICRRLGRPPVEVSAEALSLLAGHGFPGNVRELENLLERAVVLGPGGDQLQPLLGVVDLRLAPAVGGGAETGALDLPLEEGLARLERICQASEAELVRRALEAWPGLANAEIARRLGTNRRVLELRMKQHGIAKR